MKPLCLLIIIAVTLAILVCNHNVFAIASNTVTQTASFHGNNGTYPIPYNMTNGKLLANLLDVPAKEFIFTLNITSNGKLTVELPRQIIDSKRDGKDKPFLVFVNDVNLGTTKRVKANEIRNDQNARTLEINFTRADSSIGIVGTYFIENNSTQTEWNPFVSFTPLQQYQKGFDAQDVKCKDGYVLVIKSEDETPACVKHQTAQKLVERSWGTEASVIEQQKTTNLSNSTKVQNSNFQLYYSIIGGTLEESKLDLQSKSLIISIKTTSNGTLTIDIPRALLDTNANYGDKGGFFVLADGQEAGFQEVLTIVQDRIFSIPFVNGTNQIEIIATQLI